MTWDLMTILMRIYHLRIILKYLFKFGCEPFKRYRVPLFCKSNLVAPSTATLDLQNLNILSVASTSLHYQTKFGEMGPTTEDPGNQCHSDHRIRDSNDNLSAGGRMPVAAVMLPVTAACTCSHIARRRCDCFCNSRPTVLSKLYSIGPQPHFL